MVHRDKHGKKGMVIDNSMGGYLCMGLDCAIYITQIKTTFKDEISSPINGKVKENDEKRFENCIKLD